MTLEFTLAAISELWSIRSYTVSNRGEEQENAYLEGLWVRFKEIQANPTPPRFRHDLFPGCQIRSHDKHVILFRVLEGDLQIVRILHGAMDLPRHIPKGMDD